MIDEQLKTSILDLKRKYPCTDTGILPSLLLIQNHCNYVSRDDIAQLALIMKFPEARIFSVASFYSMIRLVQKGKYNIQVCHNVSCALFREESLLPYLTEKLGIIEGQTTADGMFSIETVECLGSCGYPPALMINMDHYENMTCADAGRMIDEIVQRESNSPV